MTWFGFSAYDLWKTEDRYSNYDPEPECCICGATEGLSEADFGYKIDWICSRCEEQPENNYDPTMEDK